MYALSATAANEAGAEQEYPFGVEMRTERRYYYMAMIRTGAEQIRFERRWGGLFNRRGGKKIEYMEPKQAVRKWRQLIGLRRRHGYSITRAMVQERLPIC